MGYDNRTDCKEESHAHRSHYTLPPALVCGHAIALLVRHLHLPDFKQAAPAALLARLLLWAAATRHSLSALCQHSRRSRSAETVRLALHAALPADVHELQRRLVAGLHALGPRQAHRRP